VNNNATSSYYRGYLNYNNVVFFGEINFNNLIGSIQSEKGREGALVFFFIAVVMISLYHWLGWQDKKEMVTMFGQEIFNPNWFAHEGEYGVEMSEWNSAKQDATAMVLHACITEKREEGRGERRINFR
jgi:hypothetical protein